MTRARRIERRLRAAFPEVAAYEDFALSAYRIFSSDPGDKYRLRVAMACVPVRAADAMTREQLRARVEREWCAA